MARVLLITLIIFYVPKLPDVPRTADKSGNFGASEDNYIFATLGHTAAIMLVASTYGRK